MRLKIDKAALAKLNFDELMPNQVITETDKLVLYRLLISNNLENIDLKYAISRFKNAKKKQC